MFNCLAPLELLPENETHKIVNSLQHGYHGQNFLALQERPVHSRHTSRYKLDLQTTILHYWE